MAELRLLPLAVSLGLSSVSLTAQGIGLGSVNSDAIINQPLNISIPIISTSMSEEAFEITQMKVSLADQSRHLKLGVDYPLWLPKLSHKIEKWNDGYRLVVLTNKPVKEPVVNFVLAINFQGVQLFKEVTLLMNLPDSRTGAVTNETAQTSSNYSASQTDRYQTASKRFINQNSSQSISHVADNTIQTKAFQKNLKKGRPVKGKISVQQGESLWSIAKSWQLRGHSLQFKMQAIYDANPDAFINGNINLLKQGAILSIPQAEVLSAENQVTQPLNITATDKPVVSQNAATTTAEKTSKTDTRPADLLQSNITFQQLAEIENRLKQQVAENLKLKQQIAKIETLLERAEYQNSVNYTMTQISKSEAPISSTNENLASLKDVKPIKTDATPEASPWYLSWNFLLLWGLIALTAGLIVNRVIGRWKANQFDSDLQDRLKDLAYNDHRIRTNMPSIHDLSIPTNLSTGLQISYLRSAADFYLRCQRYDLARELVNENLIEYSDNSRMVKALLDLRKSIYQEIDANLHLDIVEKLDTQKDKTSKNQSPQNKAIENISNEEEDFYDINSVDDKFGKIWNQKVS
ncbi:type IV pilus assembly protein FimV [Aliikangiella coralliicola]|nr:FimV/HubP family polar landmark protein [Aliikangiella coralliicola]